MKKHYSKIIALIAITLLFLGCETQDDNKVPADIGINNFIWKGLNQYYFWQQDVANLADDRFANQIELNSFLYRYPEPQTLFQQLLNRPVSLFPNPGEATDRFSVIYSDYRQLEAILSGTVKNNGADFALFYKDASQTSVFGVVRYVLPNSDAALKNVQRGAIFYAIDGQPLTKENYNSLLSNDTYTMNFADYNNGNISPNGQSVSLTKSVISENPVYFTSVINSGPHRIGYLMYNGFYPDYESQLNAAFSNLRAQGITELVLDLRYNSGGSVATATRLASMITGQFTNQVFAKEQWNDKLQDYFNTISPTSLLNLFTNTIGNGEAISSLNLSKVYILTTKRSASASELVINGLKPYINVVQIGDVTAGKNVGSITLYDSPSFTKTGSSTKHRYAMQPIVLRIANKVGFSDYVNGLQPNIELLEDFGNMGIIGNPDEPLLNRAIIAITGSGRIPPQKRIRKFEPMSENTLMTQLKSEMYVDVKLQE